MCSTETWRGAKGNLPKTASQGAFTQWWGKDSSLKCYCQITTRWNVSNKSKASSKQKQKKYLRKQHAHSFFTKWQWKMTLTSYSISVRKWRMAVYSNYVFIKWPRVSACIFLCLQYLVSEDWLCKCKVYPLIRIICLVFMKNVASHCSITRYVNFTEKM